MTEKNYPIFKMKSGSISAAVFEGQYGRNVVVQRSVYNKQTQEYRYEQMTINPNQALDIAFVAQEALRWCLSNPEQSQEKQTNSQTPPKNDNESIPF